MTQAFDVCHVVDFESGECVQTLVDHAQSVRALAELPDGKLASGSWDQTVRVWDVASGSCLFTLVGHTAGVCALAVLPDGKLVSGSSDKTVRVWENGSCLFTLAGHTFSVWALAALPDGKLVSGSGDKTVRFWTLSQSSEVDRIVFRSSLPTCMVAWLHGCMGWQTGRWGFARRSSSVRSRRRCVDVHLDFWWVRKTSYCVLSIGAFIL